MDDLLNQLWAYNDWANKRLFKSLEQYGHQVPDTSLRLLSHIVNTQFIWLNRVKGQKQAVGVWDEHQLEICKKMHERTSIAIKQEIENLSNNLHQRIDYTNTQGVEYHNSLQDVLLHIFNHGTYHRAQVAQNMRRNGLEPVNTDYIAFVR